MDRHRLALRREVLAEIETEGLRGVAAAGRSEYTCASCMTYISCYLTDCIGLSVGICVDAP